MGSGWEKLFFYGIEVILYVMDNGYVFFREKKYFQGQRKKRKKEKKREKV